MPEPWILGLSASHNGSACLMRGTTVVVAVQEERLRGRKRYCTQGRGPSLATRYCLQVAGVTAQDLELVVLSVQGFQADPIHDLQQDPIVGQRPALRVSHHMAHAAGAWHSSGGGDATILVIDGAGSPHTDLDEAQRSAVHTPSQNGWEHLSIFRAAPDRGLVPVEVHLTATGHWLDRRQPGMPRFTSLGGMYAAAAVQIFGASMAAGKVMGLSACGYPMIPPEEFVHIGPDGQLLFSDAVTRRFPHSRRWPASEEAYQDLAASVQAALEAAVFGIVPRLPQAPVLGYAGGVALNSVLNEKLVQRAGFRQVHVMPAADDAGVAIGAAYLGARALGLRRPLQPVRTDRLGAHYTAAEAAEAVADTPGLQHRREGTATELAVSALCQGRVLGWFQGGSALGPRALGGRSILFDPRRFDAQEVLNARVKHRESFRPFAPVVLAEHAAEWFQLSPAESLFMLRVVPIHPHFLDQVPGVAHVDGTARVQTVHPDVAPHLHQLLTAFYRQTGVPILINTSFNVMGEPIVETPADALWCMLGTGIDACVIGERFVEKDPDWPGILSLEPRDVRCPGGLVQTPWGVASVSLSAEQRALLSALRPGRRGHELVPELGWPDARVRSVLLGLRRRRVVVLSEGEAR